MRRDRDRTRPAVLRGLGWNLHRVWSTQWHINPEKCLAQIDAAVNTGTAQEERRKLARLQNKLKVVRAAAESKRVVIDARGV